MSVPWKRKTVRDFYLFLNAEIKNIHATSGSIKGYTTLVTDTVPTWSRLKVLIKKFNPAIEKVRQTLENIEDAESLLLSVLEEWIFESGSDRFNTIYEMSTEIWLTIFSLADYAYGNIYNEVQVQQYLEDKVIVAEYNNRHQRFTDTVDGCISRLQESKNRAPQDKPLKKGNERLITKFGEMMDRHLGQKLAKFNDPE